MSEQFTIEGLLALSVDQSTLAKVQAVLGNRLEATGKNFSKIIDNSFKAGFQAASKHGSTTFNQLNRDLAAFSKSAAARLKVLSDLNLPPDLLAGAEEQFRKLLRLQDELESEFREGFQDPRALRGLQIQFEAIRTGLSKEIGAFQTQARDLSRARLVGLEAVAKQQTTAANAAAQGAEQRQLAITQATQQRRVALHRAALDAIGRLERGFITFVTGASRTAVSAISKIYDSVVGDLRRTFSRREQVISGGLRNETRLFQQAAIVQQQARQGLLGVGVRNLALLGGGAGIIGAVRDTFTIGADFTQGLRVLQAQLGLTDEEMQKVRQTAIDLGNDIKLPGVSALDAATAINLLSKQFGDLGPAAEDAAIAASRGVLQLQIATKATAEEAARLVGSAVNVFGIAATEATAVADQVSQAIAKSAGISVTDFTQAFTQAATVFDQFVTPAEGATESLVDFNTAIAALAKGGLIGSDAGTSLRSFFIQANRGTEDSVVALRELTERAGETGTAFFTVAGQARPFTDTLNILRRGIAGLTDEQKTNTLQTIFGTDAIRAASILLEQNAFDYQILRNNIADSTGAAERFAEAQSSGLRRAFDAIRSSIETLQIQLFEFANRVLGPIALRFADFFGNLISGSGGFEVLRKGLLGVAAGLAAVAAARVGLEVLQLLARTIPLLLTPFGLLATLAAGLGAAFFIGGDGIEGMRETLENAVGAVRRFAQGLIERLLPALERMRDLAAQAVRPLVERVIELGRAIGQFLEPAVDTLRSFAHELGLVITFLGQGDFSAALTRLRFLGDSIVEVFGNLVDNIPFARIGEILSTGLGRAISGAGIGAIAGGVLAGPLGAALGAAFGAAVGFAIPRIRDAISRIDVPSLFGRFLEGVRTVGQRIGEILSDRRTLTALLGIVAAAAAIGAQFVLGFVQGVISNLGDIADVGALIINTLFDAPAILKALAGLAIVFGQLRRLILSAIQSGQVGTEAGKEIGKNLVKGTQQGFLANVKALGPTLKTGLAGVGRVAGQGLLTALSAGLSGSALGEATSGLEKGLSLAGLLGSAGTAFALGGGGATGTALAGVTLGVGALTAALSNNAKRAAEARARMEEYADALDRAASSGESAADAISSVFSENLLDATDNALRGFRDAGLSLEELQRAISEGRGADVVDALRQRVEELQETATGAGSELGRLVSPQERDNIRNAAEALRFMKNEVKAVGDEAERSNLQASLAGISTQFQAPRGGLIDSLRTAARDARIEIEKVKEALAIERRATAVENAKTEMEALGTVADTTRQKILDALTPQAPALPTATAEGVLAVAPAVEGVAGAIDTGLATAVGQAELTQSRESFRTKLNEILDAALQEADPATAVATAFGTVAQAIAESGASAEIQAELTGILTAVQSGIPPVLLDLQATANLQSAAAAGDQIAAEALAASGRTGPISISSKADAIAAGAVGTTIVQTADAAARAMDPIKPPVAADTAAGAAAGRETVNAAVSAGTAAARAGAGAIGRAIADGAAAGVSSRAASLKNAAVASAVGAVNAVKAALGIKSPSTIFFQIGVDTLQGFIDGFRSATVDAVSMAKSVADAVTRSFLAAGTQGGLLRGNTFAELLDNAFGATATTSAVISAQNSITSAFNALRGAVSSGAQALFSATAKEAGERTPAEQLLVGDSFVTLAASSVLGVANREAIAGAVSSIQEFAVSLLRQGNSIDFATQQLRDYRAQLLFVATSLGLTTSEVQSLIDMLGLGDATLNKFVQDAQRAQEALNAITAPPAQGAIGTPATVSPVNQFFTNNFNTPFDDPEAVSLAVSNRLAQLVKT